MLPVLSSRPSVVQYLGLFISMKRTMTHECGNLRLNSRICACLARGSGVSCVCFLLLNWSIDNVRDRYSGDRLRRHTRPDERGIQESPPQPLEVYPE